MKNHEEWIDALKGFGICCVTLGHLYPNILLETYIYSFHMFLFFFISGFLNKNTGIVLSIKKSIRGALIPLIIWDVLASSLYVIAGNWNELFTKSTFLSGEPCWDRPIWFLLVLFYSKVVYAIITNIFKRSITNVCICVLSAVLFIFVRGITLPFMIDLIPLSLFAYSFGQILRNILNKKEFSRYSMNLLTIIFGLLSVIFGMFLNVRISYTGRYFGNIAFCLIAAVSGMLFFTLLFKNFRCIERIKLFTELGKNSLFIMASQYWLFHIFDVISYKLCGISIWRERGTAKALIVSIITISFIMFISYAYKRTFKDNYRMMKIAGYLGIR